MNASVYKKVILAVSFSGFLFSGYLSAVKFFTSACALNEPCPYFLGYPSCWYGFGMFSVLFISSLIGTLKISKLKTVALVHLLVSFLGVLFAGYFTVPEIGRLLSGEGRYSLGLPTCAYGLVFYVALFVLAAVYLKRKDIEV